MTISIKSINTHNKGLKKQVMTTLPPHKLPISINRGLFALPSKIIVVLYAGKAWVPVPHF